MGRTWGVLLAIWEDYDVSRSKSDVFEGRKMLETLATIALIIIILITATGLIVLWGTLILFGKMVWDEIFK